MTPIVLLILDGWGQSSAWAGNALNHFNTPHFHSLLRSYFHHYLLPFSADFSDEAVNKTGLPYSMIGAGRKMTDEGDQLIEFFASGRQLTHPRLNQIFQNLSARLHIIGLLDSTGVHSRPEILAGLAKIAHTRGVKQVFFHLGVQGGPGGQTKAHSQAIKLNQELALWGGAHVVSLFGAGLFLKTPANPKNLRKILTLLTRGGNWHFKQSLGFLFEKYYSKGFADQDFPPSSFKIKNQIVGRIKPGDTVIFATLTPQSTRPLLKILASPHLLGSGKAGADMKLISLLDHGISEVEPLFPNQPCQMSLGAVLAQNQKKVFKLGPETHRFELGFYFSGGVFKELSGEFRQFYRVVEPSRDLLLGAGKTAKIFDKQLKKNNFDLGILSLPNADILAQTASIGEMEEGIKELDGLIGRLFQVVNSRGGSLIITAPYGNAEEMLSPQTGERHLTHTRSLVPFMLIARHISAQRKLRTSVQSSLPLEGAIPNMDYIRTLADIAPTILDLMGIPKPTQMTGQSLIGEV